MSIRIWLRGDRKRGKSTEEGSDAIAMHEEMLREYWSERYTEMPQDPRAIDPEKLRALSVRLVDQYHYRWREKEANGEIVDALFQARADNKGDRWSLGTIRIYLNEDGEEPHPRWSSYDSDEFKPFYYITARSVSVLDFITKFDAANRLLAAVLPDWNYTLQRVGTTYRMRLEKRDHYGPWFEHSVAALAIVLAILDHVADNPDDAKPWRSI